MKILSVFGSTVTGIWMSMSTFGQINWSH